MKRQIRHCKKLGMTLLEVIIGMMIIGILSAVVFERFHHFNTDLISQCTVIKAHLRYAQLRAMNNSIIWGIKFENGVYWLFNGTAADTPVLLPGADSTKLDLATKYDIAIELLNPSSEHAFLVVFDSLGRPGIEISDETDFTPSTEDLNLLISDNAGVNSQSLTITAKTGFIP